jgi:L-ascorbate metabolism protein UlaG (beta-lactamase superfamily)
MLEGITWLGHDAFKMEADGLTLYIDPFRLVSQHEKADIILITHEHYDHCSPEDVERVQADGTQIVCTSDCKGKLSGKVRSIGPGESVEVGGIQIEAVRAYNVGKKFHPKENNWIGYIFTIGGKRIYHAGDTDLIPEMSDIYCDIALLPVSGTYVMTWQEAVQAAMTINPKVAVPMHYGSPVVGTLKDAKEFKNALIGKVQVEILEEFR